MVSRYTMTIERDSRLKAEMLIITIPPFGVQHSLEPSDSTYRRSHSFPKSINQNSSVEIRASVPSTVQVDR
jgi:hypothetical protein